MFWIFFFYYLGCHFLQRSINRIWLDQTEFLKKFVWKIQFRPLHPQKSAPCYTRLYLNGNEIQKKTNHKFLGLHLDSKLSVHVVEVVKICLSRIRILKMLANKKFNRDITAIITLYKSYIQPKIDYGCAVLGSAKENQKNQSLRIASDAFRLSIPITTLQVCTGTTSLDIRQQTFPLKATIDNLYKKCYPTNHLYGNETLIESYNTKVYQQDLSV